MNSIALKMFLKNVGYSVHSLNTICVGLDGVKRDIVKKSAGLNVSWDPKDKKAAAFQSREFAIKAILVFVVEAIDQYLHYTKGTVQGARLFSEYDKNDSKEKKLNYVNKVLGLEGDYRNLFVFLMVHWRNRIVHLNSNAKLKSSQVKVLLENKDLISRNYCNLNVEKTLENFEQGNVTLKDFTTMIAISINVIKQIDKELMGRITSVETFCEYLEGTNFSEELRNISVVENKRLRERKMRTFLRVNFNNLGVSLRNELFEFFVESELEKRVKLIR